MFGFINKDQLYPHYNGVADYGVNRYLIDGSGSVYLSQMGESVPCGAFSADSWIEYSV